MSHEATAVHWPHGTCEGPLTQAAGGGGGAPAGVVRVVELELAHVHRVGAPADQHRRRALQSNACVLVELGLPAGTARVLCVDVGHRGQPTATRTGGGPRAWGWCPVPPVDGVINDGWGRFRTARAQRQSSRCLSREHPCKPPTHRGMHDPFKTASGVPKQHRGCQNSIGGAKTASGVPKQHRGC